MGQFTNGVIIGLGISFLIAPKKGDEVRVLLKQSFQTLRGNPPENEVLKQQVQQMAGRVQETQTLASRAAAMGSAVQSDLNTVANEAGANISSPGSPVSGDATATRPKPIRKP